MARMYPCGSSHAHCILCFSPPCRLPSTFPPHLSLHTSNSQLLSSPSVRIVHNDSRPDCQRINSYSSQTSPSPAFSQAAILNARPSSHKSNSSSETGSKWKRIRTPPRTISVSSLVLTLHAAAAPSSLPPCFSLIQTNPRGNLSLSARPYIPARVPSSVLWQRPDVSCDSLGYCSPINLRYCGSPRLAVACQCSVSDDFRDGEYKLSDQESDKDSQAEPEEFIDEGRKNCVAEVGSDTSREVASGLWLYYLMEQAGIDTSHAQVARRNYIKEIAKLTVAPTEDGTENPECSLDLARAALEIAAEDDALVSHSPVPLPVDAYIDRLELMALEFAGHYLPPQDRSSVAIFEALDIYLYGYKGFRRTKSLQTVDARVFYLNTVLTSRLGTPVMLALIYSELVKRLQHIGVINFSVDMELPTNLIDLPHPRVAAQDGMIRDDEQTLLLTPQLLLVEVLRSLKQLYWPWRENGSIGEGSGFLQAATAASRGTGMTVPTSPFDSLFNAPSSSGGAEVARARAAQLRLQRGIWTSSNFGDLRRALAASERLVLLGVDKQELRDYGMLLFHSGLYGRSFEYLTAYSDSLALAPAPSAFDPLEVMEGAALERLLERLRLILAEQAWTGTSGTQFSSFESPPDPW